MPEFRIKRLYYTEVERAVSSYYNLGTVFSSNIPPAVLPKGETNGMLDVTICGDKKTFQGGLHIYKVNDEWVVSAFEYLN